MKLNHPASAITHTHDESPGSDHRPFKPIHLIPCLFPPARGPPDLLQAIPRRRWHIRLRLRGWNRRGRRSNLFHGVLSRCRFGLCCRPQGVPLFETIRILLTGRFGFPQPSPESLRKGIFPAPGAGVWADGGAHRRENSCTRGDGRSPMTALETYIT